MKKLYTLVVLVCFYLGANAQISKGKDFWFGLMENYETDSALAYITTDVPTTGMISIPSMGWSQTFSATPGISTKIVLPITTAVDITSDAITGQGIHVVSRECISVFSYNGGNATADASIVYPINSVGQDYIINTYQEVSTANAYNGASELEIIANYNNTTVTITPSVTAGSRNAGVPYSITLDTGQTYLLQAVGDLSGTRVTGANGKDFSVCAGSTCITVNNQCCCDHIYEQMSPIANLGNDYITVPYGVPQPDRFRIVAIQNGTTVNKNGALLTTLNAGQYYDYNSTTADYLTSNKNVSIIQLMGSSQSGGASNSLGDPFMIALSPTSQRISNITFPTITFISGGTNYWYLNMVAKTADVATVKLDGVGLPAGTFIPVVGNNIYSTAHVQIQFGDHHVSSNQGVIGDVFGYSDQYESFGYQAGVLVEIPHLSIYDSTKAYCPGDPVYIALNSPDSAKIVSSEWDLGDGSPHLFDTLRFTHTYANYGTYPVTFIYTLVGACEPDTATIDTIKILGPAPDLGGPYEFCTPQSITLNETSRITPDTLFWRIGNNSFFTLPPNQSVTINATQDTVVYLKITSAICPGYDTAYIYVGHDAAAFTYSNACNNSPVNFNNTSQYVNGLTYQWLWDFGDGTTSGALQTTHTYASGGTYNVKLKLISPAGCIDSVTHAVTIYAKPTVAIVVNPVCNDSVFTPIDNTTISNGTITYDWNFGDGSAHVGSANPSHIYHQSGAYNVTLVASGGPGCSDSITLPLNMIIGADIRFSGTSVCAGQTTTFTDLTLNNSGSAILDYSWDFGDGGTSTNENTTHTYATSGSQSVTFTLDYGSNCFGHVTQPVWVNGFPAAAFTAPDLCNTGTSSPANTSTITTGSMTYSWNFGDGSAAVTGQSPTHNYAMSGNYNIQLIAVSDSGCRDTVTNPIVVIRGTNIAFTAPPVCVGVPTIFTNQTTNTYNTTIAGYSWDFGDGNSSTQQNTTNTYAAANTYNAKLVLNYGNNCADSLTQQVIVNAAPVAAFTVTDICNNNVVSPQNTSTGGATSYTWSFGDGSAAVTGLNPQHTYQQSNTYTVQLIAVSGGGCSDTITEPVILIRGTQIAFTAPQVCLGATTVFTNTTANPYNTTILGYTWSFGDGNSATQQNTTNTYAAANTYNAKLVLDYGNNCADSLTQQVIVNPNPTAAFTIADVCNDSIVAPQNTSSGGATSYAWNFGDGSAIVTGQNPPHTYHQSNTYNVQLIAVSGGGCGDTITEPVNVIIGTHIDFSTSPVCIGAVSTFMDQTTNPYNTTITGYNWTFGDGNSSTLQNATNTYVANGTFTVQLELNYSATCADSFSKQVTVNPNPTAGFTIADVCNDSIVTPQNSSTGATSYIWNFGDGTATSTGQNPAHTYTQSNQYTVKLVAVSSAGCTDSITNPVTVVIGTHIDFSVPPVCLGAQSVYTDRTSNPYNTTITGYNWTFGDGGSAAQQNTTNTYAATGNYTVQLRLTYNNNCADSFSKQTTVNPNPVADFSSTTLCVGSGTQFTDLSTPAGLATNFAWSFGDGGASTTENPAHVYATAGSFNVQYIAFSAAGCADTITKPVTVLVRGVAAFTATDVCFGANTQFTNTTNVVTYPVNSFAWTFGDATGTSVQVSPSYQYGNTGNYNVTLIANFTNGCDDTVAHNVNVFELPRVAEVTTNVSCYGGNDGSMALTPAVGMQPFAYNWSNVGTASTDAPVAMGTYIVTFTDAHTCSGTATYDVTQPTPLIADSVVSPIQCASAKDGSITINATGATPGYSFSWNNGAVGNIISQLDTGTYVVTITDSKGCSIVKSISIAEPLPYIVVLDSVATIDLGQSISLVPTTANGNAVSWLWTPIDFLSCATCQNPTAQPVNDYSYVVQTVSDKGCIATATIRITVVPKYEVFVPNAFTPNGDGNNDYFEVFGNKEVWKQFEAVVYDRIGEKVFETNDMNFKWDGVYKGVKLNPAVFVYIVKVTYTDNHTDKVYKGSVTLIR